MPYPKIVLICHYFPPHNNCGVRRILYWANSLANQGCNVTVFTSRKTKEQLRPDGIDSRLRIVDFSYGRIRELKHGSLTDFQFSKQSETSSWKRIALKLKRRIINPFFGQIADPNLLSVMATILSIWLSSKLRLRKNQIDFSDATIISTAPPWSMHLLGTFLAGMYNSTLFIDYRDQFSNNHMFGGLLKSLENKIDGYLCRRANRVITISPSMKDYYSRFTSNPNLIMNGFDPQLFWPNSSYNQRNDLFCIRYFGSIHHETRLPKILLDVTLEFFGDVPLIEDYLIENPELKEIVSVNRGVPLAEVRALMAESDCNLLCETMSGSSLSHKGVMTTKLFEYLAVERPVLALISPYSDMVSALSESGLLIGPYQSKIEVLNWLNSLGFESFKFHPNRAYIQNFSRETSVELLLKLLEDSA